MDDKPTATEVGDDEITFDTSKASGMTTYSDRTRPLPGSNDLVSKARRIFGDRLTRVIATGRRPEGAIDPSLAGLIVDDRAESRLRDALGIADQLLELEAKSTVQAWFVGKNPMLGDRAPALVVADDPDAVRRAARHFLANG